MKFLPKPVLTSTGSRHWDDSNGSGATPTFEISNVTLWWALSSDHSCATLYDVGTKKYTSSVLAAASFPRSESSCQSVVENVVITINEFHYNTKYWVLTISEHNFNSWSINRSWFSLFWLSIKSSTSAEQIISQINTSKMVLLQYWTLIISCSLNEVNNLTFFCPHSVCLWRYNLN